MKATLFTLFLFALAFIAPAQEQYKTKKQEQREIKKAESIAHVRDNIPAKGSSVFIKCDNSQEERILPHLKDRFINWGYWTVTENIEQADVVLELVVRDKNAPFTKGYVILKRKDGIEITRSGNIATQGDPGNGMSQWRGFSIGVGRWLKGEKEF
jgi:hypothetical protein